MKRRRVRCKCILVATLTLFGFAARANAQDAERRGPNIVIIYADDLGYGDVQCYNPTRGRIPTPHLDRLASQGMRFTDAHSSSAVCSPSRYTLLTGRYHWRSRLQSGIVGLWKGPVIPGDRVTIASLAKQCDYSTACIGKWHLGWNWPIPDEKKHLFISGRKKDLTATPLHRQAWREVFSQPIDGGPTNNGFDEYFGTDVPNWPPYCFIENDRTVGIPTEYLPLDRLVKNQASIQGPALEDWTLEPILPAIGERASRVVQTHSKASQPFLLYVPLTAPHTPLAVNDDWKGKSGLGMYGDFVMETDAVVGRLLETIDEAGVADNTLVVFTSDNGCAPYIGVEDLEAAGHFPSGPLRGYKSDAWEGGHRVPFVVRWPGHVEANSRCDQLVHQADLLATLADILDVTLPATAGEDSFNITPLLEGDVTPIREHAVSCSIRGLPSLRQGQWKMIPGEGSGGWTKGGREYPIQLYNLSEDVGETTNLAKSEPERVESMQRLLEKLISDGRSNTGPKQRNDVKVKRYP